MRRSLLLLAASLLAGVLAAQQSDDSLRGRIRALRAELVERTPAPSVDPVTARRYDVASLLARTPVSLDTDRDLPTSNTIPEDPIGIEPIAVWRQDTLLEFVTEAAGPDAQVDLQAGLLRLSGPPAIHARIERLLSSLAARVRERMVVEIEVVPAVAGDDEAWTRSRSFGGRTPLGSARVPCTNGIPQAYSALRERHYISDYDEQSAREAGIGRAWRGTFSEGLSGDVLPCLDRRGGGVLLHLRVNWQRRAAASRTEDTSHGPVTLPALDAVRLATSAWLPLHRPVRIATCMEGMTPCHVVVRVRTAG